MVIFLLSVVVFLDTSKTFEKLNEGISNEKIMEN